MNRRSFIKTTSVVSAGALLAPNLISAANYTKRQNVILFIVGGGVRNSDALNKNNMPNLFGETNSLLQQGTLFNRVNNKASEITHSLGKYAILNASYTIDDDLLHQPWKSKVSSGYVFIHNEIDNFEKLFTSFNYAVNNDTANFIVINTNGADVAHYNFSEYLKHLNKVDDFIKKIWETAQNTHYLKDNTVMMVMSEHGRNNEHNSLLDKNGIGGLDHYSNEARTTFALVVGNKQTIKQNNTVEKETDLSHVMGFCEQIIQSPVTNLESGNFKLALA